MHVETNLLNSISNIWMSEGQVLQSSSKTAKVSRIRHGNTTICRELGICINRRGTRLAVRHASSLKDLHDVLMLRQQKTRTRTLHMHTQNAGAHR